MVACSKWENIWAAVLAGSMALEHGTAHAFTGHICTRAFLAHVAAAR